MNDIPILTRRLSLIFLTALYLASAAKVASAQEVGWPRKVHSVEGDVTIAAKPERVVSTTPSITGILLAIGAPLASTAATTPSPLTDAKGFFLQWAKIADERGVSVLYPNLNFDIEAVIAADPELLVASASGADSVKPYVAELVAQGVPTVVVDYANQSWQDIAVNLGSALGLEAQAADAISRFDRHVSAVARTLERPDGRASVVAYNLGGTYSVARPISAQARVLAALGFEIAELPEGLPTDGGRTPDYAFVSRELLAGAITGETVFLMNGTERSVQAFLADPVLANLPAVREKRVYPLGPTSFRIDYYSGLQMADTIGAFFGKQ